MQRQLMGSYALRTAFFAGHASATNSSRTGQPSKAALAAFSKWCREIAEEGGLG